MTSHIPDSATRIAVRSRRILGHVRSSIAGALLVVGCIATLSGCDEPSARSGQGGNGRDRNSPEAEVRPRSDLGWGLYQIYWGRRYGERLDQSLAPMASTPDYVMFYRDLGRGFPSHGCEAVRELGATPILSLELWHWGKSGHYLPDIATGGYDDFFRQWAREAKEFGSPVYLRFGFEMNGDWFSWGGRPGRFIECWRRAHALFESEGADNVVWLWSPNAVSIPREPWNEIDAYYPGDDVVDWVGLDGYNFGEDHSEWHRWETFEDVFAPALDLFAEQYPGKPVMIAEFGCAPGRPGEKAEWIRDAFAYVTRRTEIRAAIWFDLDKRREGEPNWSLASEDGVLEAFNETFARPRP